MKCTQATIKCFFDLSDAISHEIRHGNCSAISLIKVYKIMIQFKIGVAFHRLGLYYLTGILDGISIAGIAPKSCRIRVVSALKYLKRAYALGVKESAHDIAWSFFQKCYDLKVKRQSNVPRYLLKQLRIWVKRALVYEHGRRKANMYHYLAWIEYHYGNLSDAISFWKKAARNGGGEAMLELAIL